MSRLLISILLVFSLPLLVSCATHRSRSFYISDQARIMLQLSPAPEQQDVVRDGQPIFTEADRQKSSKLNRSGEQLVGIASWYGPNFHRKATASGEIFDQNGVTAAHRLLPMNTWVKVTRTDNGKSLVVRINDRGPYKDNRVIDLSKRSAELLEMHDRGTARVKLTVLKLPASFDERLGLAPYKQKVVQLSVFKQRANADRFKVALNRRYRQLPLLVDNFGGSKYQVVAGPYDDHDRAKVISRRLQSDGYGNFVRSYRK